MSMHSKHFIMGFPRLSPRKEAYKNVMYAGTEQGGGESFHGLWRSDQPHGHGVFRWFDGDKYLGSWKDGWTFCLLFCMLYLFFFILVSSPITLP